MRSLGPGDLLFIAESARWTLLLSAIAFAGGVVLGLLVALARTSESRALRYPAMGYIRVIQGTPLLMQLFLAFFGPNIIGISVNPWAAAAIGLVVNASAFLGEIWRGCIEAVPRGQWEAATALGLHYWKRMRFVILPQALRVAIPPTVGFLVQLIKATSLASIIGFVELTRAAQVVNNATFRPFLLFGVVAVLYFAMCWPLSLYSRHMERRLGQAAR
jgi:polar amino acid transport system permease protein